MLSTSYRSNSGASSTGGSSRGPRTSRGASRGMHNDDQMSSSSDATVAADLKASAEAAGLSSVSVSFEDAAGFSVPVVTGKTSEVATFVHNYRSAAILGATPPFASFVEVTGESGSAVYAEGLSAATNQGTSWVKPGLSRTPSAPSSHPIDKAGYSRLGARRPTVEGVGARLRDLLRGGGHLGVAGHPPSPMESPQGCVLGPRQRALLWLARDHQ